MANNEKTMADVSWFETATLTVAQPVVAPAAMLLSFAAIFAWVHVFANALIDDAFIQLKYSQTLATSGTWGFYADRITNTATSPLNVLLTAAFGLIAPSMIDAAIWLTAVEFFLVLVFLLLASRALFNSSTYGVLAFAGLVTNPLLLSTIGLEGILLTLWMSAAVYCFASKRWLALAAVLGALTLTRADGVLLFAMFLILMPVPIGTRLWFIVVYAFVLTPWHLYSWIHLGSFIPDTMKIKMFQRQWSGWMTFPNGPLLYFRAFPLASTFSVVLLPGAVLLLRRAARPLWRIAGILSGYGVLHFLAYSTIRVPPYHWYYVNQIVPVVLVGALGLASVVDRAFVASALRLGVTGILAAVPAIGIVVLASHDDFRVREMPIHSNWASHEAYREMGAWIEAHTDPSAIIFCSGEIGTLAFYSHRHLINEFSDMNRISENVLNGTYDSKPIVGPLMRVNYYWRRLQPPYPPPQYRLQGKGLDAGAHAMVVRESTKTWEMSSRFVEWLTPHHTISYWLSPVNAQAARP